MTPYISLHNHTSYSILDSLLSVKDLFYRAKELEQAAIAITDHGTLGAAWEGLKYAKETGVKLIMGCEMYFLDDISKKDERFRHIILLAKNTIGYRNLLTLNKEGFDNRAIFAKRVYPLIDWNLLEKYHEGIICLTACSNGIISQLLMNKKMDEAEAQIKRLQGIFGEDFGLEVQANTLKRNASFYSESVEQVFLNAHLIRLGKKLNVKVVATTNAHYLKKEDYEIHDTTLAIGSHQPIYSNFRLKYDSPDFYMKTGDEIKSFFERNYGDFASELCANSLFFADRCEFPDWINPKYSNPSGKELPTFPINDELDYTEFQIWLSNQGDDVKKLAEDSTYLRFKSYQGFERYKGRLRSEQQEEYIKRIDTELSVLDFQGFSSYMLIVSDYINWAKNNGIPCGPGRGSGGGSLIGFLLGIHQADPIKYDLIFERFQTKGKLSPPDYDLDFGAKDRYKVIDYIIKKYGEDYVAHISNFNTITPKVYVRDIARVHELGGSREEAVKIGNNIADVIPAEVKSKKDLDKISLYVEYAKRYPKLTQNDVILGKFRNLSTHAAAIVIGRRPLVGLVPLRRDKDGALSIEYEKNTAEDNGLVKMDLLGLSTLDIISNTNSLIEANGKKPPIVDYDFYDVYDEKTYNLITKGDTYGVFQFGTSGGTIDLCKKIKPKNIDDLSIITTLARPAAANIRKEFIETREGKRESNLLHPILKGAFEKTYGYGLYDESILRLGSDVAGWDLNEADRIRKMIKEKGKNPEKEKKLGEEFVAGAVKNRGLTLEMASAIWNNEIKKFASYTFNRAHATTYSMISYHTAFLKAHFPIEFLLANLMFEVDSNSPVAKVNIAKIKNEIKAHKVKIIAPDINKSQLHYAMEGNKLITGLDALKYVSEDAVKDIIAKRPFKNFQDFMVRVDSKKVRSNTIQALAACGCLDSFDISRQLIFLYCSDYRKKIQVWIKKHDPNQEQFIYPFPQELSWESSQVYALEQFYLGDAFICGIKDAYGKFFKEGDFVSLEKVKKSQDKTNFKSIKGVVKDLFEFRVKKEGSRYQGQAMAKIMIEDIYGNQCSGTIFPDRWEMMQDRVKEICGNKFKFEIGIALHLSGTTNHYDDDVGLIIDKLYNVAPIPQKPIELKGKKISLRPKKDLTIKQEDMSLFIEIEEELINEGMIDDEIDDWD